MIDSFQLNRQTCLIAGGCGKIGYPIAQALASLGARIILCDRSQEDCDSMAANLPSVTQGSHIGIECDITDTEQLERLADRFSDELSLDTLIHCVGFTSHTRFDGYVVPLAEQTVEAWRLALETNLTSAFALCQKLEPALKRSSQASVVLLSSIYGELGPNNALYEGTDIANPVAYGASKGGLLQLMRYLATQWAPDVRVNCVSPGGIDSDQPNSFKVKYATATPLKRMATPDDIVGPVAFLASDAARYVTGHNLVVDGGWSAW